MGFEALLAFKIVGVFSDKEPFELAPFLGYVLLIIVLVEIQMPPNLIIRVFDFGLEIGLFVNHFDWVWGFNSTDYSPSNGTIHCLSEGHTNSG